MSSTTHGQAPGADTPKKESAGGCDTTTADTNNASKSIALWGWIEGVRFGLSPWVTVLFGGLA
jgi:hypothetical protein